MTSSWNILKTYDFCSPLLRFVSLLAGVFIGWFVGWWDLRTVGWLGTPVPQSLALPGSHLSALAWHILLRISSFFFPSCFTHWFPSCCTLWFSQRLDTWVLGFPRCRKPQSLESWTEKRERNKHPEWISHLGPLGRSRDLLVSQGCSTVFPWGSHGVTQVPKRAPSDPKPSKGVT